VLLPMFVDWLSMCTAQNVSCSEVPATCIRCSMISVLVLAKKHHACNDCLRAMSGARRVFAGDCDGIAMPGLHMLCKLAGCSRSAAEGSHKAEVCCLI
jgi:hypothetical protein